MQNRHAGDAVAESTEERPAAVAPTRDAKYSRSRSGNGQVTGNGPGAATQQAGGGNGREPTIRELQMGIQANRQRIIRLEKQTKKGFKRTHREIRELRGGQTRMAGEIRELCGSQTRMAGELRELCDLQREMRGQMRAMIWIMGVIGGVTVLARPWRCADSGGRPPDGASRRGLSHRQAPNAGQVLPVGPFRRASQSPPGLRTRVSDSLGGATSADLRPKSRR